MYTDGGCNKSLRETDKSSATGTKDAAANRRSGANLTGCQWEVAEPEVVDPGGFGRKRRRIRSSGD